MASCPSRRRPALLSVATDAATAALLATSPVAGQGFEGVLTMTLNPGAERQVSTMWVKGKALRMEIKSGGNGLGGMVITPDGRMLMLAAAQKQYYELGSTAMLAAAAPDRRPWQVEKLGSGERLAGVRCEWYRLRRAAEEGMEYCITQDLGDFGSRDGQGVSQDDIRLLRGHFPRGFFPLKAREPGTGDVKFEITAVEKRPVTANEVGVPAGWTELKVPTGRR